jgi:hypothetical protein
MPQQRIHNEWFQDTVAGKCSCGSTKRSRLQAGQDTTVWIWGEYHIGKWRRINTVCESCFDRYIIPRLVQHAKPCGCTFQLNARSGHGHLPSWIRLPDNFNSCAA